MSPFRSAGEHQTSEFSVHPADFGEAPLPRLPHRDDHLADRPACDAAELWMCLGERKADSRCRQRDGRDQVAERQHHPTSTTQIILPRVPNGPVPMFSRPVYRRGTAPSKTGAKSQRPGRSPSRTPWNRKRLW